MFWLAVQVESDEAKVDEAKVEAKVTATKSGSDSIKGLNEWRADYKYEKPKGQ